MKRGVADRGRAPPLLLRASSRGLRLRLGARLGVLGQRGASEGVAVLRLGACGLGGGGGRLVVGQLVLSGGEVAAYVVGMGVRALWDLRATDTSIKQ